MDLESPEVENVNVTEAWERLGADAKTQLIDVRSRAEWAYVGQPDLSSVGRTPILIEWLFFPDMSLNSRFVEDLSTELESLGVDKGTELLFMCRSGVRSLAAAKAMSLAGYMACRNVADGFEGPLDDKRHRGTLLGWKAAGLPWVQG